MAEVRTRLIIGITFAVVALGLIILDLALNAATAMMIMVALCTSVALYEFYCMVQNKGIRPLTGIGIATAVLLIVGEYLVNHIRMLGKWEYANSALLLLFLGIFGLFLVFILRQQIEGALTDLAVTVFGIIYVWGLASFILRLRFLYIITPGTPPLDVGMFLIVLLIPVAKMNDSTAYFAGRYLGRRKLAPKISPGKTIAGLVGGLIGGVAGAFVVYLIFPEADAFGPVFILVFALLVGAMSHIGDLAESLLKRAVGVKDSSRLFPEAGGILDLIDGLLFASPAAFFVTVFLSRAQFLTVDKLLVG